MFRFYVQVLFDTRRRLGAYRCYMARKWCSVELGGLAGVLPVFEHHPDLVFQNAGCGQRRQVIEGEPTDLQGLHRARFTRRVQDVTEVELFVDRGRQFRGVPLGIAVQAGDHRVRAR